MDVIALLGMDEGDNVPPQQSQGHESLLPIGQTVIFIRVRDALEDFFCINEIEPVFVEVRTPFSLMPSDHRESVYTNGICVKGKALRGLPRDHVLSPDTPHVPPGQPKTPTITSTPPPAGGRRRWPGVRSELSKTPGGVTLDPAHHHVAEDAGRRPRTKSGVVDPA